MNRAALIYILLFAALLLTSCKLTPKQNTQFIKCPDGRLVGNVTDCDVTPQENITTNTTSIQPAQNITQNQTPEPERNFSTLRHKQDEDINKTDGIVPNLNGWSVSEIVEGMSAYNKKFIAVFLPSHYIYSYHSRSSSSIQTVAQA